MGHQAPVLWLGLLYPTEQAGSEDWLSLLHPIGQAGSKCWLCLLYHTGQAGSEVWLSLLVAHSSVHYCIVDSYHKV